MVDPPYVIIANRLEAGKVVPFLGAGASLVERPPGETWTTDNSVFLPSGLDVAHFLADTVRYPKVP